MSVEQEVTLYKTKLAFQRMLPWTGRYLMEEKVSIDKQQEFARDILYEQIHGYLYGEPGESQTISYPSDWWSAFKQRWFPEWLLRRYPADIMIWEINLLTLYPHFKVSLPNEPHVLKYTATKVDTNH